MKATKQYFPVVLFIVLYKVVLTFESVAAIPGVIEWPFTWKFLTVTNFHSKVCFWALSISRIDLVSKNLLAIFFRNCRKRNNWEKICHGCFQLARKILVTFAIFAIFVDISGSFLVSFFSKSCYLLDLLFLRFLWYCKWFSYIIFSQLFLWRQLRKKFSSKFLLTRSILDISELYSLMLVVVVVLWWWWHCFHILQT